MENIAIQKASQIDSAAREWLQQLFGRSLSEDEEVTIFLPVPHGTPATEERSAALSRAGDILNKSAENMQNVPDKEFDETLNDALQQIRKRTD